MDVYHTALWVSDLEATRRFYEDALGLSFSHEFEKGGTTNYYVTGGSEAQLQFKYDPDRDGPVKPAGVDHLAILVDDVDATFEALVAATDCPVVQGPADIPEADARAAFVEDPDGYVVEIVAPLE